MLHVSKTGEERIMGFRKLNTELDDPHMNRESRESGDLFQLLKRSK